MQTCLPLLNARARRAAHNSSYWLLDGSCPSYNLGRAGRLSRHAERLERDQNIQIETLALFIRYFLTVSTPVPEAHQDAARAQGKVRFEQFVEQLGRHLLRGRSLVRDVVEELHPDPMQMDDAAAMASAHERTAERAS